MKRVASSAGASRKMVSVGCKLPNGLILHLYEMVDDVDRGIGGTTKNIKLARRVAGPVTLNGSRYNPDRDPGEQSHIRFGCGFTDVDEDFMRRWMDDNRHTDIVMKNLVFIEAGRSNAEAHAKELEEEKTGMEPIAQDRDPRMPNSIRRGTRDEKLN